MKLFNLSIFSAVLLCFYSLTACAEPPNLSLLKKEVRQYHDSGDYEKELAAQIDKAKAYLLQQVAYYHAHQTKKKLALVLDIDETSISNYDKFVKRDFGGNAATIHKEILKADSPAIKATLSLYQTALKHHVDVFFVTGRVTSELEATKNNLIHAGYTQWAKLYLRPEQYKQQSIIPFKSSRRAMIEKKGYIILASIGDQHSDFKGGHTQKGFKLPNPYYYIP